jgi:predicted nucleic-acid-binding Zn-ribbon protein
MKLQQVFEEKFDCPKCKHTGAKVDKLAMSGTGLSRFMDIQLNKFAFVSCLNCGFTEIYNLKTLGKRDGLGDLIDILFAG